MGQQKGPWSWKSLFQSVTLLVFLAGMAWLFPACQMLGPFKRGAPHAPPSQGRCQHDPRHRSKQQSHSCGGGRKKEPAQGGRERTSFPLSPASPLTSSLLLPAFLGLLPAVEILFIHKGLEIVFLRFKYGCCYGRSKRSPKVFGKAQ